LVYSVPTKDLNGTAAVVLRIDESATGQRTGVKSAFDYYIGQV
jgi:hypothetical protein